MTDEKVADNDPKTKGQAKATEEGKASEDAGQEVEVVRVGGEAPAPNSERPKIGRRERGLLRKNEELLQKQADAEKRLNDSEAARRILELQLQQLAGGGKKEGADTEPGQRPTLESCGYDEAKFERELEVWHESRTKSVIRKQLQDHERNQGARQVGEVRQRALLAHYERADTLGLKDYDETEEKAVAVLGKEIAEDIAATTPDSNAVLYFLGKNPEECQRLRDLFEENPALGTFELGKLAAGLKVQPKPKKGVDGIDQPAGNGATGATQWQRKVDDLREKFAKGNSGVTMKDINDMKQKAKAAGANIR